MIDAKIQINGLAFSHVGWKYYNSIRKKAMEQEFSWTGLSISLSIAFFIVIFSALILNFTYNSLNKNDYQGTFKAKIYQLERAELTRVSV